ncbi:cell shape-determining protein MreC [Clostridium beijerinckii]|uniref:hypothetical protein n=1 Tax=Clostridium beijerinckii TaxID=1520 RepID=UPI001A9AF845|nr:hypothetical protein [Clostridium beijerinckii]NOW85314.1 cell shape-determining protein MreC [Clostridium beijerinckii]
MKASKGNKVYSITEQEKEAYKKQGYDIIDDEGEVIEYGTGKSVSHDKYKELENSHLELIDAYNKLQEKCRVLEKEKEELRISAMTVDQLKAYAADRKVDLGDATTREAILSKFKEALGITTSINVEQTA